MNSAAVNVRVHVSFLILVLSEYMPRSGTAESYGNSSFRRLSLVAVPSYIPPTVWDGSLFCTLSPAFAVCRLFLMTAALTSVRRCLIVVLICLVTSDVEHLFMCPLSI